MAVLLGGTPACLVEKHVEDVSLLFGVDRVQLLIKVAELEKALGHEVVLDALVLEVSIHGFDQFEIVERETHQLIRSLVLVEGHD